MLKMCLIWYPWTCKKHVFEWNGCQKSLKPEVRTSTNKYQKMVSKRSQNPWKIGFRTQQKTMLKNRAQKKNHKIWPQNGSKKVRVFWGKSHWGAFGGPNRFCDEKVGPQRSQSAPKNDKWTKISEKIAKTNLKMASKRAPRVKKSFKSGFFRNQKRFLKTELKPLEKHKKWVQINPPKVNNHIVFNPGPADCAKRLQLVFWIHP